MTDRYLLAVYYAALHFNFYRQSLYPFNYRGYTLGQWAEANRQIIDQVVADCRRELDYELSHNQIGMAIGVFLCEAPRLEFKPREPTIKEAENVQPTDGS